MMKNRWVALGAGLAVGIAIAATLRLSLTSAAQAADDGAKAAEEMRKQLGTGFTVERTGIFVVAGNLSRTQFDRFKKGTVEECSAALWKDFFAERPDGPIRVYLFKDKDSYENWVEALAGFKPPSPYGFYLPSSKWLMMNIGTGGGTLVHEMTHALMDVDFPNCPTWLFEGMGSLFEQCWVTNGHIKGLVTWRLPVLMKGGFTPLETLIKMPDKEFRGEKESLNYANARYLCLYLQERGLLAEFYKTFREAHKAGKDATGWASFQQVVKDAPDKFEKDWQAWVKKLKWPQR